MNNTNSDTGTGTVIKALALGLAVGVTAAMAVDKKKRAQVKDAWKVVQDYSVQFGEKVKSKAEKLGADLNLTEDFIEDKTTDVVKALKNKSTKA